MKEKKKQSQRGGEMPKKPKVEERLEELKKVLFENWKAQNGGLGVKRYKLMSFFGEEKRYLKRRAIADLRREKKIYLNRKNYFIGRSA